MPRLPWYGGASVVWGPLPASPGPRSARCGPLARRPGRCPGLRSRPVGRPVRWAGRCGGLGPPPPLARGSGGRLAYRRAVPPVGAAGRPPGRAPLRRGRVRPSAGSPRRRLGRQGGGSWPPVSGCLRAPWRGLGALAALRPCAAPLPALRPGPPSPALSGGPASPWAAAPPPPGGARWRPQAAQEAARAPRARGSTRGCPVKGLDERPPAALDRAAPSR